MRCDRGVGGTAATAGAAATAGDAIGNAEAYTEMQRLIPGSELITYDAANHNICDYLPERCARDALEFLDRKFPR